jgi:hypothetical protein
MSDDLNVPAQPVALHANPSTGLVTASAEGGRLPDPDPPTNDFLWRCVVLTCCLLLLVIGVALTVGLFVQARGFVAVELVQGIFLVVFGLVAGLLAPSPTRR